MSTESAPNKTAVPASLLTPALRGAGAGHFLGLRWSSESTLTVFNAAPPPPPQSQQPGYEGYIKRGESDDTVAHKSSDPPQQHKPAKVATGHVAGTKCPLAEIQLSSLEQPRHGYARALHARGHAIFSWLQRRQQQEWFEEAPSTRQFETLLTASSRFREALRRCTQEAQQVLEAHGRGEQAEGESTRVEAEHLLARAFIAERSWALAELCCLHPDGIAAAVANSAAGNLPGAAAQGSGVDGLNGPITPRGGLMDRQDTSTLDVPATAGPRGAAVAQWIRQTYHSENEGGGEWESSSRALVGELAMRFARPQVQDALTADVGGNDAMDMDAPVASVLELAHLCAAQLRVQQSAEEAEAEASQDPQAPLHRDLLRRLFWPIVLMFVRRGDLRWAAGILLAAVPEDQLQGSGGDGYNYVDRATMAEGNGSSFSWLIVQQTANLLDIAPQELHGADDDALAPNFGDRWAKWRHLCAALLSRIRSSLPNASDTDGASLGSLDGMSSPTSGWVRGGHAAHPILDGAALQRGAGAVLRLLAGPDAAVDPSMGMGASTGVAADASPADEPGFELDRFAMAAVAIHGAACAGESNPPDVRAICKNQPRADWHERLCARLLFYAADCGAATLAREARTATGGPRADGNEFSQAYLALLEGNVGLCLGTLRHREHGLLWAEAHLTDLMHRADTIRRSTLLASSNPSSVVWVPLIPEYDGDMDQELDGLCLRDWLLLRHASHLAAATSGGWQQSLNYVRAVLHDALVHDARGEQENASDNAHARDSHQAARQSALWQGTALLETVVERHEPGCDSTTEKMLHALGAIARSATTPALAHGSHGAKADAGRSCVEDDAAVVTAALLSAGAEAGCAAAGSSCARAVCLGRARRLLGGRSVTSILDMNQACNRQLPGIEGAAAAAAWLGRAVLMPVGNPSSISPHQPQAERLLVALIDKLLHASLAEGVLFAANTDANAQGKYSVNGDALRRTVEALKPVAEACPSGNTAALPSEITRTISTLYTCVEMLQALSQRYLLQCAASTPGGAHLGVHIGHLTSRVVCAACALLGVGVGVDGVARPDAAEVLLPVTMWLPVLQLLLLMLDADADADAVAAAPDARPTLLAAHVHALLARLQTVVDARGVNDDEQTQTTGDRAQDSDRLVSIAPDIRGLQRGLAQVAARATLSPRGVVDMF